MSPERGLSFAKEWIAAWNEHDLPAILSHYSETFEMTSPYIQQLAGAASGTLKGKAAVGEYWSRALARFPSLHFTLERVLLGVDSIAIYYHTSVSDGVACEVLAFGPDGLVHKASAHYEARSTH